MLQIKSAVNENDALQIKDGHGWFLLSLLRESKVRVEWVKFIYCPLVLSKCVSMFLLSPSFLSHTRTKLVVYELLSTLLVSQGLSRAFLPWCCNIASLYKGEHLVKLFDTPS